MPADDRELPAALPTPFASGRLDVGEGHELWFEQSGAPHGLPAVILHGGPGSGSTPRHREFFDGSRWRLVQFDQRGCGRSTPAGGTTHNHTAALVADIETLRAHLGIERWLVFGGSWGASLALAYAAAHRERVSGVVLRGAFLAGRGDTDWFFRDVAALAPVAHAQFIAAVPLRKRRNIVDWLARCLAGDDETRALAAAAAWQAYENRLDGGAADTPAAPVAGSEAAQRLLGKYRIQSHYLARRCFLGERAVLRAADALGGVPMAIVHGTQDLICRPQNSWRIHRACAGSRLAWAEQAGHHPWHPASARLLRSALAAFAATGDFAGWPEPPR